MLREILQGLNSSLGTVSNLEITNAFPHLGRPDLERPGMALTFQEWRGGETRRLGEPISQQVLIFNLWITGRREVEMLDLFERVLSWFLQNPQVVLGSHNCLLNVLLVERHIPQEEYEAEDHTVRVAFSLVASIGGLT